MFLNKLEKKIRVFFITWIAFAAIIILIAALAHLGAFNSRISNIKIEEIKANPQLAAAVQLWRKQGATENQIEQQVLKIADGQAAPAIAVMKKASFRAAVIAVISCVLFYFLFVKIKNINQQKILIVAAIIGLLLIDQVYIAHKYIMAEPTELTLHKPEAIAKLLTAEKPFRVSVVDKAAYNLWVTSLFKLHGIECIEVPADSRPSPLRKIFFYSNAISPVKRWQYSNVKYILGHRRDMELFLGRLGVRDDFALFYSYDLNGQKHAVYEYKNTLPRVYAVGNWIVLTNTEEAVKVMNSPSTDPRKTAVVMDNSISEQSLSNFSSSVKIDSYEPEEIKASITLSAPGIVALITEPAPDWKVKVDGKEKEIFRCNLMHQGVLVQAGNHSVEFYFAPREFWVRALHKYAYAALPVLLIISIALAFLSRKNIK